MTGTIPPTAAPAPANGPTSSTATDGVHTEPQAPFGPALARAQEQVSRGPRSSTSRSSEPDRDLGSESAAADETVSSITAGGHGEIRDEAGDDGASSVPDTVAANGAASDAATSTPATSNTAASATAASGTEASTPATSSGISSAAAALTAGAGNGAADAPPAVPSADLGATAAGVSEPGAAEADPATHDHPTAKGTVGDGGPSITPTVEGSAPPAGPPVPVREGLMSSGAGATDPPGAAGRSGDGPATAPIDSVSGAGSGPGQTAVQGETRSGSLGTGATSLATGIGPVENGAVGQAVAGTEDGPRTPPTSDATAAGSERTNRSMPDAGTPHAAGTGLTSVERPPTASTEPALSAQHDTPGPSTTAASADGAESLVVLAREAGRSPDAARATAPTPVTGPVNPSEGSLWEDVRMAFDRIRSSGDGQEVRIRLHPAELGELVVQVRTQGEQVAVRLTTSSSAAQQALVDDRLRLAAELARAGFEEGSVDIGRDDSGGLDHTGQEAGDRGRERTVPEPIPAPAERLPLERRDPIRTESGVRVGRHAYSTINLTL